MRWTAIIAALVAGVGSAAAGELVHVNQATPAELVAIGLSDSQAAQIVRYRSENGAFLQADELLAVPQISRPVFDRIRPQITVEDGPVPPTPPVTVDPGASAGTIAIEQPHAEWQNLYGAIVYAAGASVRNAGAAPVRAVKVRLDLLDKDGHVVGHADGYNLAAEALTADPKAAIQPIAAGGSDPLRLSIDKSEISAPFRSTKLTVVDVLR